VVEQVPQKISLRGRGIRGVKETETKAPLVGGGGTGGLEKIGRNWLFGEHSSGEKAGTLRYELRQLTPNYLVEWVGKKNLVKKK